MNNLIKELEIIKLNIDKIISKIAMGEYCTDKYNIQPEREEPKITREKEVKTGGENIGSSQESPKETSKEFKPTEEQRRRWKQIPPTKKTKGLLAVKGFSNEEIESIKTQDEANIILNNLKKENI